MDLFLTRLSLSKLLLSSFPLYFTFHGMYAYTQARFASEEQLIRVITIISWCSKYVEYRFGGLFKRDIRLRVFRYWRERGEESNRDFLEYSMN